MKEKKRKREREKIVLSKEILIKSFLHGTYCCWGERESNTNVYMRSLKNQIKIVSAFC